MCQINLLAAAQRFTCANDPPQGMQRDITPYALKLASTLVDEYEPHSLTKEADMHIAYTWEWSYSGTLTLFSLLIYYNCSLRNQL